MDACELTILMPCLNEAQTLATCIEKAKSFLVRSHINGEILIADNGSTDGSQQIAEDHGAKVITVTSRGYGAALKAGIHHAQGTFIIMGDADDSYDFSDLNLFMMKLRKGYQLVMGNRFKGGIMQGAMPFLNRYLGNPVLSFIGRLFYKSAIGDFHCGLRGFHKISMQNLELQGDGMEFASEMVIKATLKKLTIAEVPITLFRDGRNRKPHLRPFRDGWRHLRLLLLLSPKWLFLYPGMFLFLLGFSMMSLLMMGPIVIGNIMFGVHTLLFSGLFMVLGFQAMSFSIFSRSLVFKRMNCDEDSIFMAWFKQSFTLEKSLLMALLWISLGIAGSSYALINWTSHAFGALSPEDTMRIVIPSVTAIILGMQLVFSSFFMSFLELD